MGGIKGCDARKKCCKRLQTLGNGGVWIQSCPEGFSVPPQGSRSRLFIGDERTTDVEVVPNGVRRSIRDSKCCTERTATFIVKESPPVPRWHSRISGESLTTVATFAKTSPTTLMRI